jgi:hypothetical protein
MIIGLILSTTTNELIEGVFLAVSTIFWADWSKISDS